MNHKFLLSGLLTAAFLFTAAFAAVQSDLLHHFFTGGTSALDADIQNTVLTGQLGDYRVTIHEALNDDTFGYLIVSFEALSDTAQAVLDNADQISSYIEFDIDCKDNLVSYGLEELTDRHTPTADYYAVNIGGFYNPERKPLRLRIAGQEGQLDIPMANHLKTVTLTPFQKVVCYDVTDGAEHLNTLEEIARGITVDEIRISPFGVMLRYTPENPSLRPLARGFLYFELKDGTVCTEAYFRRPGTGEHSCDDADGGRMGFQFRTLDDFDRIRAIVLGNTAYPLDGGTPYPISVNGQQNPFLFYGLYRETFCGTSSSPWWLPVKTLCESLGAEYVWNETEQCGSITYRGETFTLAPGENTISVTGRKKPVHVAAEYLQGELFADLNLRDVLRIEIDNVDMESSKNHLLVIP